MKKLYLKAWNMEIEAVKIEVIEKCDNAIL